MKRLSPGRAGAQAAPGGRGGRSGSTASSWGRKTAKRTRSGSEAASHTRRRRLGQHFLTDPSARTRLVDAFAPGPEDLVVEIGPGRGALTDLLAGRVAALAAIELDGRLAAALRARYAGVETVRIVEADALAILRTGLERLAGELGGGTDRRLRIIGNLPYAIATPIVSQIAGCGSLVSDALVMVQKEVADRILAEPGGRDYGLLTLAVAYRAKRRRIFDLPPGAFRPPPQVRSSVVALEMPERPAHPPALVFRVEELASIAFSRRRKTILNALESWPGIIPEPRQRPSGGLELLLRAAGIDPTERPERIDPTRWLALARQLI